MSQWVLWVGGVMEWPRLEGPRFACQIWAFWPEPLHVIRFANFINLFFIHSVSQRIAIVCAPESRNGLFVRIFFAFSLSAPID